MIRECGRCKKFLGQKCPKCGHGEPEIWPRGVRFFYKCSNCATNIEQDFFGNLDEKRSPMHACGNCGSVPPILARVRFEILMECANCATVFELGQSGITTGLCSRCYPFERARLGLDVKVTDKLVGRLTADELAAKAYSPSLLEDLGFIGSEIKNLGFDVFYRARTIGARLWKWSTMPIRWL